MDLRTSKILVCLVMFAVLLVGCGGGGPYVGLWQCTDNPDLSLKISRFEEYFVITSTDGGKESKKEGTFANDVLSVGKNIVGKPMALALDNDGITCTNPPNFCRCTSTYAKVDALTPTSNTASSQEDEQAAEMISFGPDPSTAEQVIRERDPTVFNMVNGGSVHVFDHAENEENEKRVFDGAKLKYYVMPQLALKQLADNSFAEVRHIDDEVSVFFQLTALNIDNFELMENVHKSISPRVLTHMVLPLSYASLTIALPGSSPVAPVVVTRPEFDLKNSPLDISLSIAAGSTIDLAARLESGREIAQAINDGSTLPIASFEVIQRPSAENSEEVGPEAPVTKIVNVMAPR